MCSIAVNKITDDRLGSRFRVCEAACATTVFDTPRYGEMSIGRRKNIGLGCFRFFTPNEESSTAIE